MKTTILFAASMSLLAGCSVAARSPDMFRDDTGKAIATKNEEIRGCYDGVLKSTPGAQGKVTIKFDIETEKGQLVNVTVDKAGTTAPQPVADCVTKSMNGLAISPPDARKGEGSWVFEFNPPAPQAPPPPPPPKT
jgi:hypothetical protein